MFQLIYVRHYLKSLGHRLILYFFRTLLNKNGILEKVKICQLSNFRPAKSTFISNNKVHKSSSVIAKV